MDLYLDFWLMWLTYSSCRIFCFAYMVEGASGFGTPVALGAPMLVSTGHSALNSVVVLLIMNTFATVWGAVGTPIWFGFAGLTDDEGFIEVSYKAAVALAIASFLLVPLSLTICAPWTLVKQNLVFVFCSLAMAVGPGVGIAFASFEFPSLLGGMIGCAGTAVLIHFGVGLSEVHPDHADGRDLQDIGSVSENSIVRKYHESTSSVRDVTTSDCSNAGQPQEPLEDIAEDIKDPKENGSEETGEEATDDSLQKPSNDDTEGDETGITADSVQESSAIGRVSRAVPSLQDTLDHHLGPRKEMGQGYVKELVMRTFPIWAVVLLLVLTRVEQIGIKEYLTKLEPNFAVYFGTYGTFRLSVSVVLQLSNIMTYPGLNWKYELLYLPFLMPFVLVSIVTMIIFRKDMDCGPKAIAQTVASRLAKPTIAMFGALCLVQLLIKVDTAAPSFILGNILADWFKEGFIVISPLLGALGSFFSGSTTVSNLTFGQIQVIAAQSIGTSETTMLALQAVGASAGNGICLNNIISACAVVGLNIGEGKILMQTYKFVLANTTIATIVMLAFFFRF
jgi:L-lactate permease